MIEAAVCVASALAVVRVHLWMVGRPSKPIAETRENILDRVVDEAVVDMRTIDAALDSLSGASGIEFRGEFTELDQLAINPAAPVHGPSGRLTLRRVTARQALLTVLRQYGIDDDVELRIDRESVRLRLATPRSARSPITRVYDLRDMLPHQAREPNALRMPAIMGTFSAPGALPSGYGNVIEGVGASEESMALCQSLIDFTRLPIWASEFQGRLVVTTTSSEHARIRRMIEIWHLMR